MLKQTVQFEDFDGVNKTKVLYFNLTRSEVIDNLEIQKEFQDIHDMINSGDGDARSLEMHEVRLILELVKKLMRLSYGVQKEVDGNLAFTKKGVWDDFTETAVYDAFLMDLFENAEKAVGFLTGIWPKQIRETEAFQQLQFDGMPVTNVPPVAPEKPTLVRDVEGTAGTTPIDEYTDEALLAMPQAEFDALVGTNPLNMTQRGLRLAFIRKTTHQ